MSLPDSLENIKIEYEFLLKGSAPGRLYQLRTRRKSTGFLPVLLGTPAQAKRLFDEATDPSNREMSFSEILAEAKTISIPDWIASRQKRFLDQPDEDLVFHSWDTKPNMSYKRPRLESFPNHYLQINLCRTRNFSQGKEDVIIAKFAMLDSWKLPALFRYGNWNECPSPAKHVALHQQWYEKYKAEIVAISSDTIEMMVGKPPRSKTRAIELASAQFAYCSDIVFQGVQRLDELASFVWLGKYWFFWWD